MILRGMLGMGDNIYQRAVLRELREDVYLMTSWPQLYSDLPNIYPVRVATKLRTQTKNAAKQDKTVWHDVNTFHEKRFAYNSAHLRRCSILEAMSEMAKVKPTVFDVPQFDKPAISSPYAVIRPVTNRIEWLNIARGAKPEYVKIAAKRLKMHGFTTVSVADIVHGVEWADSMPDCDINYNHGELDFEALMGLIQGAAIVVGGVGWIVPASIASGVPLICILGGQGGHNGPEKIVSDPMDDSKVRWITPDRYCRCTSMKHNCSKTISGFMKKFETTLSEIC